MRHFAILSFAIVLIFAVIVQGQDSTQECEPGSVFFELCNICKCNDDGTDKTCTATSCQRKSGENPETLMKVRKFRECRPGSIFTDFDGCSKCKCMKNGLASCTYRECDEPRIRDY